MLIPRICVVNSIHIHKGKNWTVEQDFSHFELETDTNIFFETDTNMFKKIFTDIWPNSDIRLATITDIQKFAYWYFFRYFNQAFWLKLVWIAYSPDLRQPN